MHELAVCQALMDQVADMVKARGADEVQCITIEVGPLSGTEPALLFNAFMTMRSGHAAAARLRIKRCPVKIRCLGCDAESEVAPARLVCSRCGGWRTQVVAGDELRLLRVEMRLPGLIDQLDVSRDAEQIGYV